MITSALRLLTLVLLVVACSPPEPQKSDSEVKEPVKFSNEPVASGSLVIVGGAMRDTTIFARFMELAGGWDAPIVVIPAARADTITEEMIGQTENYFNRLGATNFKVLHTKDHEVANSEDFIAPIQQAKGVWFTGGRQWRIVDSYMGTRTLEEFNKVLQRGGVIGGSSAGATIQGSYLARGDTKTNTVMMGDHQEGFSFMKSVAIDQHLLRRNRQHDLVEILEAKPELLGIGLDENTAIVVQADTLEVIGKSFVAIYDTSMWPEYNQDPVLHNGGRFFLLGPGDRYNFVNREVIHWRGGGRQLE